VGGGALEVGKVGTVGETGTLTVGTGTLMVGAGTLTVGRLGVGLAGAIAWPEPYPALNTHAPMISILVLAPAPLAMISHCGRVVWAFTPVVPTTEPRRQDHAVVNWQAVRSQNELIRVPNTSRHRAITRV
jgi:hypothetical protein